MTEMSTSERIIRYDNLIRHITSIERPENAPYLVEHEFIINLARASVVTSEYAEEEVTYHDCNWEQHCDADCDGIDK